MKVIHCDICKKRIRSDSPMTRIWDRDVFIDMDENPIEDVCEECFKTIYCCINMMKETKWKPDFHEVTESGSVWDREVAENTVYRLQDKTGLKFER